MMTEGERSLFSDLITQIGNDWEENHTAEAIRMDEGKLSVLLAVQKYLTEPTGRWLADVISVRAPAFCSVFHDVTLREIKELVSDGSPNA